MSKSRNSITDFQRLEYSETDPIFNYFNPTSNETLSNLSGNDLQDLIILLDNYLIQLRERLGFSDKITFGLEIEYEDANEREIERKFRNARNEILDGKWRIVSDSSLYFGAEVNSPVMRDCASDWKDLNIVCSIIKQHAMIGKNCGGHIHIGTQVLGEKKESWLKFLRIWSAYENIIYRFLYGDFLTGRSSIKNYAEPMTKDFWNYSRCFEKEEASIYRIISNISCYRNQAVNFGNIDCSNLNKYELENTIEFRCPNGTLNPAVWQNNVNFLVRLLLYSRGKEYDNDKVLKRHNINSNKYDTLPMYDEFYIEQALELCDMIFDNNFDKIYFLKQYLKSLQIKEGFNSYPKAKTLSKSGIKSIK